MKKEKCKYSGCLNYSHCRGLCARHYYLQYARNKRKLPTLKEELEWANCQIEELTSVLRYITGND